MKKVKNSLNIAMYLTMALSLIIISVFAFAGRTGCTSVQIKSKIQVWDKYFYQFSEGSGVWAHENFSVGERVCVSNPPSALAQK